MEAVGATATCHILGVRCPGPGTTLSRRRHRELLLVRKLDCVQSLISCRPEGSVQSSFCHTCQIRRSITFAGIVAPRPGAEKGKSPGADAAPLC